MPGRSEGKAKAPNNKGLEKLGRSVVQAITTYGTEGGHAKDFAGRYYKGTYAAGYLLPITPLYYEAVATNDVLSYLRAEGSLEDEQAADRILYPAYGTYLGNSISTVVPGAGTPLYLAGVLGGHVVGRVQADRIVDERAEDASPGNVKESDQEDATMIEQVGFVGE